MTRVWAGHYLRKVKKIVDNLNSDKRDRQMIGLIWSRSHWITLYHFRIVTTIFGLTNKRETKISSPLLIPLSHTRAPFEFIQWAWKWGIYNRFAIQFTTFFCLFTVVVFVWVIDNNHLSIIYNPQSHVPLNSILSNMNEMLKSSAKKTCKFINIFFRSVSTFNHWLDILHFGYFDWTK